MSSVYPSGAALAARSAPTTPPPPGRLSMTIGFLKTSVRLVPIMRDRMSVVPPGNPTEMNRIGRSGYSAAAHVVADSAAAAAARLTVRRRRAGRCHGLGDQPDEREALCRRLS